MISVRSVSKAFGRVYAVRDVSFEVGRGEVVGLLGANGAGKTTTIRMVTGFLPPDLGAITVNGHDTLNDSLAARASIGYLPESAPAYGEMTTQDYLDFRGASMASGGRPGAWPLRSQSRCASLGKSDGGESGNSAADFGSGLAWPRRCFTNPQCWSLMNRPAPLIPGRSGKRGRL